ncbi:hypothetical protein ABT009_17775 [Streptomyces sp. NPDC002896]|uniref:hypothetical protein n=1 Tax=Streptomyces sp. NPDC002896 TaxID=3154438 RepID=UPI00331FE003
MGDDKRQHDQHDQHNQHKADLEQAQQQVNVIDATQTVSDVMNAASNALFGRNLNVRLFGRTDFEGHRLNNMLDLVEHANPQDLESAGLALSDAGKAISDAAHELSGHISRVDWDGESGEAFRKWGDKLVTHAHNLADFADVAGTQITAAATGLASVRSAMPPRDTRPDPKAVHEIPAVKRVETNDEYVAAVKVEKDRQEAINQMNRLSSFYAVSEETLAGQEPPVFEPMPDVGVPKPLPTTGDPQPERPENGSLTNESGTGHHAVGRSRSGEEVLPSPKHLDGSVSYPDRHVGTEIDSVGTLPQEAGKPTTVTPPSVTGPSGPLGGTGPHFVAGPVPNVFGGPSGRSPGLGGATGARTPVSAQGRLGTPAGTSSQRAVSNAMGPTGRAAATGQAGVRGAATATGRSPMGRSVTGGMPRTGGTAGGPVSDASGGRVRGAGVTGAGRTGGVVGGKPTTGATPGTTGPRIPRGTVIGGEGAVDSRSRGEGIGRRGVIGAPNSTTGAGAGQTPRRSASNPDGVIGAPKGRVTGTANQGSDRAGSNGLVRRDKSTEDGVTQ